MKKLFVVSDIHGHDTFLREALDRAGYDMENEDHWLIGCGDYFNRGKENVEVLNFLERVPRKVLVRGNHEDQLLRMFRTGRMQPHQHTNGTFRTVENFFGKCCVDPMDGTVDFFGRTDIIDRLCEFIEKTVDYCETEHYLFVHGWVPKREAFWRRASKEEWEEARRAKWHQEYTGRRPLADKTLVCGHVPTFYCEAFDSKRDKEDCSIFFGNGLIVLDSGVADTHQVNVLVLENENPEKSG